MFLFFVASVGGRGRVLGQAAAPGADRGPGTPSVSHVLERLRVAIERVRTIEYKAKIVRKQLADRVPNARRRSENLYNLTYNISYKSDGNLFYSNVNYKRIDGKLYDEELAYDGSDFQRFGTEPGLLELSKNLRLEQPAQSLVIQPIVTPFAFAFNDVSRGQIDYPSLINPTEWERLAKEAAVKGEEKLNGQDCIVLDINTTRMGRPFNYVVYLDKGHDLYPVKFVASSPAAPGRAEVTVGVTTVGTKRGAAVVPLRIDENEYNSDGKLLATALYEIEPATLKVNAPVDRRLFTIDRKRVWNGVLDEENNILKKSSTERRVGAVPGARPGVRWMTLAVVLINTALALTVMTFALRASNRTRRTTHWHRF